MTDGERPAGLYDSTNCQESVRPGRPYEVDLELNRKHFVSGRRDRECCVATSAIRDAGQGACMDIPVLLREFRPRAQCNMDLTLSDMNDLCAERSHEALRGKTRGDLVFLLGGHRLFVRCPTDSIGGADSFQAVILQRWILWHNKLGLLSADSRALGRNPEPNQVLRLTPDTLDSILDGG